MAPSPVYPENKTQFPNGIVSSVSFVSTTNTARSRRIQLMGAGEQSRRSNIFSPLGFQSTLRCGLGRKSGTQEGQQVGIYRVCVRGRHAVREALVGL